MFVKQCLIVWPEPNSKIHFFFSSVWAQLLNRRQNRLALIRIPMDAFRIISSSRTEIEHFHSNIEIILEEMSDYWINVSFLFRFRLRPNGQSLLVKHLQFALQAMFEIFAASLNIV